MREMLEHLLACGKLSKLEASNLFHNLVNGNCNSSQASAVLTALRMRSLTVDELAGFRHAALDLATRIDLSSYKAIDVCGTGGDGKSTFNISTLSALIAAACGIKVAKHGSYAVSSKCGSSNVLEKVGYRFTIEESELKRQLERAGICFLHAPLFHPSFKNIAPVRKELGVKTFFNMLGPLVNPTFPIAQVIGVYNMEVFRLFRYLAETDKLFFGLIHSEDGYDEVSLTADCICAWPDEEFRVSAKDFGLEPVNHQDLFGGNTVEDSVRIFLDILENKGTQSQNAAVIANAACALKTAYLQQGKKESLIDCAEIAKESLLSGKAYQVLKKLIDNQKN